MQLKELTQRSIAYQGKWRTTNEENMDDDNQIIHSDRYN